MVEELISKRSNRRHIEKLGFGLLQWALSNRFHLVGLTKRTSEPKMTENETILPRAFNNTSAESKARSSDI